MSFKIDAEQLEDHRVRLTVQADDQLLEQAKRRAARRISQRMKIPGFRPGKAPYPIVQRQVGEAAILEEALEMLVDDIYPQAIDQSGIRPYGPGTLENVSDVHPPTFEFRVPLAPQVDLGDYRSLRFPYEPPAVTDEEVEQLLEGLRESQAIIESVDRAAQEGDIVYLTMRAVKLNPEEAEDAALITEQKVNILIEGDEEEDEWPFPGFSRQLIGLLAGERKTLRYRFSNDDLQESLRGVQAEFTVQIDEVKSRTLPELNDELAQTLGDFETLEGLRQAVRELLENKAREDYHSEYDEEIIEELLERSTIKYPPEMVEEAVDEVQHQLEERLAAKNLDLETYLKARGIDEAGLRDELRPVAEERIKRTLLLMEVVESEGVELDPEEVRGDAGRTLDVLTRSMDQREARRVVTTEVIQGVVAHVARRQILRQALKRLRQIASGQLEPAGPAGDPPEEGQGRDGTPAEAMEAAAESKERE